MRFLINKLQTATGLSWKGSALFDLPTGIEIAEIVLKLGTGVAIDNLRLQMVIQGESFYDIPMDDINVLHAFNGRYQDSQGKVVVIPFHDNDAKSYQGRELRKLIVNNGEIATLKIDIGNKPDDDDGIPATPEITGHMQYIPTNDVRSSIPRITAINTPAGAIGEREFMWGFPNRSIHGLDLHGGVTELVIERGGIKIFEQTREENNHRLKRLGYTPQNNVYHFRPSAERYFLLDLLAPQNLKFIMTCDKTDSIRIVSSTIEQSSPSENKA